MSFKLTLAATLLAMSLSIISEARDATCKSGFEWMFNSLGQNPCTIAEALMTPCPFSGTDPKLVALQQSQSYVPEQRATICDCTTVVYSLANACAVCQGASITSWKDYSANCTPLVQDAFYPFPIPDTTRVPAWAYQSVEGSNTFNVTLAQSVGDAPEYTPLSTPASTPSSKSSLSDPAVMVPTIIGIVLGVSLFGGAIIFILLRRFRSKKIKEDVLRKINLKTKMDGLMVVNVDIKMEVLDDLDVIDKKVHAIA